VAANGVRAPVSVRNFTAIPVKWSENRNGEVKGEAGPLGNAGDAAVHMGENICSGAGELKNHLNRLKKWQNGRQPGRPSMVLRDGSKGGKNPPYPQNTIKLKKNEGSTAGMGRFKKLKDEYGVQKSYAGGIQ